MTLRSVSALSLLLVAMAVFALLMASLMQFFVSAQKLWSLSASKAEMFEGLEVARVVIVELLRDTGVLEVKGFSGHG